MVNFGTWNLGFVGRAPFNWPALNWQKMRIFGWNSQPQNYLLEQNQRCMSEFQKLKATIEKKVKKKADLQNQRSSNEQPNTEFRHAVNTGIKLLDRKSTR
eukprot:TRINITY_DN33163_c0_g1_i4.p1 TRINITY_DN33163_c0_g1~~TRINITY_DN33163_c0_g1_i4.p1  ORF type:complete len:100 (+),score=7.11 TRINITY_DN33163_c0_g1_i4:68-367(+)